MKKILFTLLLFMIAQNVQAKRYKDSVIQYFDRDWKQINKNGDYEYFRIAKKLPDSTWHVKDYFADSARLQMEGVFLDDSFKVKDGQFYFYHYNGNVSKECSYNKGKRVGLYRAYNHKGALIDSTRYKSTGIPFHKSFHWDDKGRLMSYAEYDMQGKGTGYVTGWWRDSTLSYFGKYSEGHLKDSVWSFYHRNGNVSMHQTYSAGVLQGYTCYDWEGKLISNCDTAQKLPEPPYDISKFLSSNMRMPKEPLNAGMQGLAKVFVNFIVDADGSLIDFEIINHTNEYFIKEALRVVKTLPPWKPARQDNRNIPVWYTLPISFRIE